MNAVVNAPISPLMSQPNAYAQRVDEVLCGWPLMLEDCAVPGWYHARSHCGYSGHVSAATLVLDGDVATRWAGLEKDVVVTPFADVLAEPKVQGRLLTTLVRGCLVVSGGVADESGWQPIVLSDGAIGYTKSSFVSKYYKNKGYEAENTLRGRVVEAGLSYLGTQYRWGGKTPMGIDCSGLTAMAYLLCGVVIFRDARIEPGYPVRPINRAALRKADLLYFPGHVAMYLGEGRYLHATARAGDDGVVISSLDPAAENHRADLAGQITAIGSIFPRE